MFYIFNLRKWIRLFKIIFLFIIFLAIVILGLKLKSYVFPIKHERLIEKYAEKYGVEKSLVFAVINVESRFDDEAISNKGARGLMQILPDTALWIAEKAEIDGITLDNYYEIENNIKLGVWYLAYFLDQYDDPDLALASYNAGRGNVLSWLDNERYSDDGKTLHTIPFEETRNYVKKVGLLEIGYKIIFGIKDMLGID